jgi:hypothetical protein
MHTNFNPLHFLGLFVRCCFLFKAFKVSGLMCIIISVVVLFFN